MKASPRLFQHAVWKCRRDRSGRGEAVPNGILNVLRQRAGRLADRPRAIDCRRKAPERRDAQGQAELLHHLRHGGCRTRLLGGRGAHHQLGAQRRNGAKAEIHQRERRSRQGHAPKLLSQFRYDLAVAPDDSSMLDLVDDLKEQSRDFRSWWEMPDREKPRRAIASVLMDGVRRLNFRHETLVVDDHRHLRMTVYFLEAKTCFCAARP